MPTPTARRPWGASRRGLFAVLAAAAVIAAVAIVPNIAAADGKDDGGPARTLRLIQVADTHGKFVPHWEKADAPGSDGTWHNDVGGFARTYALVQKLKNERQNSNIFVMNGDNFHGSAELMFTKGRAVVPIMNKFAPDAYNPGNWDYAEGSMETRARFVGIPSGPLATPNGKPLVTFPVITAGFYNNAEAPAFATSAPYKRADGRVFQPYLIKEVNGIKVAILGLNDDKPSDQAATFTVGFNLHAGFDEAPALVKEVRAKGAEIVVAMSEAGLAQNVALARDVPGIDVVLSGDTHEETYQPISVPHANGRSTLVVESGEGSHVGQMDLRVAGRGQQSHVVNSAWKLHEVVASMPVDAAMQTMVDNIRKPFLSAQAGGTFSPTTFARPYPGGGVPMKLTLPLDQVVGKTDVDLQRHSVVPTEGDEFIAEAIRKLSGAQIAGTNGFRYDAPVPAGQNITVGDVYQWLPIGANVTVGKVTGSQLRDRFEKYLAAVLDPNPYRRTGGWLPVLAGARFTVDYNGPHGPGQDRIVTSQVYDDKTGQWETLQDDRIYTIAGCYSVGDALDRMCRMNSVRDMQFLYSPTGNFLTEPTFALGKPNFPEMLPAYRTTKRVAPNGVVAAPEALLRFLMDNAAAHQGVAASKTFLAPYAGPTWTAMQGTQLPAPSPIAPDAVQPLPGSGPDWLAARRVG